MSNLVSLCRHHHHLVHEGGFVCRKSNDGKFEFIDQRGETLKEWYGSSCGNSGEDVQRWFDREFFAARIDERTCVAQWQAGNTMDWQMAVSALF